MARWPSKREEVRIVTPPPESSATESLKPEAPAFDPSRPHSDAHYKQDKYWVQNGWLYTRGTARPVREVK